MLSPKAFILLHVLDIYCAFAQSVTGLFTYQRDVPFSTNISLLTDLDAPPDVNTLTYCALQCRLHPLCNVIELCHFEPDVVCRLRSFPNPSAFDKNDKGICQYFPLMDKLHTDEILQNEYHGSCAELKERIASAEDGEYWLFPVLYRRQRAVKIYCHNMAGSASEYLTLSSNTNYIIKHEHIKHNYKQRPCRRDDSVPLIKVSFSKNMAIIKDDLTFTHVLGLNNKESVGYGFGEAHDCTGPYYHEPCTRFGSLAIDLRGTGFAIDPSIEWKAIGHLAKFFNYTHSADRTRIFCLVGGYCGICRPNATITLALSNEQNLDKR